MSDIQAPTNDSADDILTQGVLEGLDDLYDFGDSHCKEISVCTDRGSASAMAASADAKGGSEVLDQLDDMGAAEAEEIIQNFGGFGRAPMSVGMPAKSEDQMRKDAELADMDDQEAQKIINSLGGFAKPGLALTSSRSHGPKHGQCIAAKDELNGTELSDMADAEAQRFIRKFGGFSKAAMDAASQCSADDIAMNPTPPPPKPASHEAPQLVHTPCSHKDAAANDGALLSIAKEMDKGIDSSLPYDVLTMTASKAAEYCFPLAGSGQGWGFSAARQALLARGCMPGVATEDWVKNHFRWCVWSCASYARRFPARCQEFWTTKSIISRLLYRYEREFVRGERSTLKKVLEADASPQQLMVLCIATISWQDKKTVVEVTDGWYGISALVDPVLEHAIARGRLRVGDKIACCGLRMSGIPEGASPLSAKAKCASLILHANCVRRAHWYAKLGFEPASAMFLSLSAVHEHGGPIGAALDVVIVRSYPMLYMETLADGRRIVRSEKEECRVQHAFESAQAAKMQEIAEQMMTPKKQPRYSNSIGPNSDAKDLYSFVMDRTMDSGDVGQQLTPAQIERLDQYAAEKRSEDESAVLERLRTENPLRQVQPLFKLLVCDYPSHQYKSPERNRGKQALVTVWGPRNVCPSDFVEGSRFILTGLSVSASKNGSGRYPVCLNFNAASSRSKPMPADPSVIDQCDYYGRATLWVDELRHIQTGQEIDVQGIVDEYVSDDSSQMSLLRLKGEDESSTVYHASIEFSAVTFGKFNIGPGDQLTVCNCRYMHYDPLSHTFIVKAGDIAKFLVS
ncbi:hypothetical protein GGI12_001434 [Dipsacomyces acuminosporus]|nr:hypothetical protein GGI12_001434 [Dipsacomyces acuminosporus]